MADDRTKKSHVRIAGLVLAAILVAATIFTYLGYTAAFSPTDKIVVEAPRSGLVMEVGNKVKYRGIQIGKVTSIDYDGDMAKLTLAVSSDELKYIPSNAKVQIAGNTVFGAKSVEFLTPSSPNSPLKPGTTVKAGDVQVEMNTLFQSLTDVLEKIDPLKLNGTLSALGEGLRGNGDNFGATMAGLNSYLDKINPKLPTMQKDFAQAAVVTNIYGDAAPDFVTVLNNTPELSKTIVDQQDNLNATLLAATGLGNNGYDTLAPAANDYIAAMQRFRAPTKLLGDYSPEYGCMLNAIVTSSKTFGAAVGGTVPGLFVASNFLPGSPAYTYPESLPIVNATGGPNCRGLPDLPSKQHGGSWYRAPFLVTDNAYVPYQPNTEVQFDAPSTLQFLFNGAFAERNRY